MPQDQELAEFSKSSFERVAVSIGSYKGYTSVHIRLHVLNESDDWRPTPKGVTISRPEQIDTVIEGLKKAKEALQVAKGDGGEAEL